MFRTVTITSVKNSGNDDPVSCTKAIRGLPSWRVMREISASYVRPECMYSIPYTLAPGPWKPGDLLTDSAQVDATAQSSPGVTYTVLLSQVDEGFWLLTCFNPKISYNLRDTGNILLTSETLTSLGTRVETTSVLYANEVCRIQPSTSTWAVAHNRVGDLKVYDVFMAAEYDLQPSKHLFSWTDANGTYTADIRSVQGRNNIGDLMQLTVELRPGETGTL